MKRAISLHFSRNKENIGVSYHFGGMKMSFCTAPDQHNRIRLRGYFDTCRETVIGFLRAQLEAANANRKKKTSLIDLKRTRLILFVKASGQHTERIIDNFRKKKDKEILISLKLVNHYERKLGWPRTKMQKLDNRDAFLDSSGNNISNTVNMYMVVGSSRWMKSPHLLSLYMLLLRLGVRGFKAEFETHTQLLKELEDFGKKHRTKSDVSYVRATYDKWDILLESYDKLFGKRTIKSLYDRKSLVNSNNGFNEGIYRLCIGNSYDLDISHKFTKICKSNNIDMKSNIKDKRRMS